MRNIIIATFCFIIATSASANEWRETCGKLGDLAEVVMTKRQGGVSMAALMEAAEDLSLLEEIIITAYEQPRFSTKENQAESVEDFRNMVYLECVKSVRDK